MNLKSIKEKLDQMNSAKTAKPKAEKKNVYWKPSIGKEKIRVVPSAFNKENPFTELSINYSLNKTIISPTNWGERDPINEFISMLKKQGDKEKWLLSKKLEPKTRTFLPIVVRGKEDEGVKLWQFGKEIYMAFLNLADDEEIGDFTDILNGRDITVTTVGPESTGTQYNKSTIMPAMKPSPLSEDKDLVEKLLNEQPNPEEQFTKYSYEDIKNFLATYINNKTEEVEQTDDEDDEPKSVSKPVKDLFKD